jgi:hypothetical protein
MTHRFSKKHLHEAAKREKREAKERKRAARKLSVPPRFTAPKDST